MSLKEQLTAAKDKTVAFYNDHKQEVINTLLIGATIGTVITLKALVKRVDEAEEVIAHNAGIQQRMIDHPLYIEKIADGEYKSTILNYHPEDTDTPPE